MSDVIFKPQKCWFPPTDVLVTIALVSNNGLTGK